MLTNTKRNAFALLAGLWLSGGQTKITHIGVLVLMAGAAAAPSARAQLLQFSLDIGSDNSSDPNGTQCFDPGDMYHIDPYIGGVVCKGSGEGGVFDDSDPFSTKFLTAEPWPSGAVPFSSKGKGPGIYTEYFDLDAFQGMPIDLSTYTWPIKFSDLPNPYLFPFLDTLYVSFDDDDLSGWVTPGDHEPVNSTSASPKRTYGTTESQDEVMWVSVGTGTYPVASSIVYKHGSETDLHVELSPNPDSSEEYDDDVDALGLGEESDYYLFSADHEGRKLFYIPGHIYQWNTLTKSVTGLISPSALGIPPDTDVDAITFAWIDYPVYVEDLLSCLFSVDEDDPETSVDESGGLNPKSIYASALTNSHFELLSHITVMYGVDRDTDDLYLINKSTGATSSIGSLPYSGFSGFAADGQGECFVVYEDQLIVVDFDDPAASTTYATLTSSIGDTVTGMSFDSSGTLHAVLKSVSSADELVAIDTGTGDITHIGYFENSSGTSLGNVLGIAFEPGSGKLYALDRSYGICEIDPATAEVLAIYACSSCSGFDYSLVFDLDGTLYIADEELLSITLAGGTASATSRGSIGLSDHVHGLAIVNRSADIDALVATSSGPILPMCYADCDQSTGVRILDIFDFLCFQNSFVNASPYACGCDTSTGQRVCDIFDFLCFQNAFVAGCQ